MAEDETICGHLPRDGTGVKATVIAAGVERGRHEISTVDAFIETLSRFDLQARIGLPEDVLLVDRSVHLAYLRSQVAPWRPEEIEALRTIVDDVAARLATMAVSLPDEVVLVKTTGAEEAGAAYTRGRSVVVLPANMVASLAIPSDFGDPLHPGGSGAFLRGVLIHELFHLQSKHDPDLRRRLYEKIGYDVLPSPLQLPETPWPAGGGRPMRACAITNPDTPVIDVAITLPVPESGGFERPRRLTPLLLSDRAYAGGRFFDYLQWWFAEVDDEGAWVLDDDLPVLHASGPLQPAYLRSIGRNFAGELFHPDEVLAQNFVLLADELSVGVLAAMSSVLRPEAQP